MRSALIGYSGFVGSNLAAQNQFDDLYDASNIAEIDGKSYDLVVSAGARSDKWRINQEPKEDLDAINNLISHLKTIQAKQFVLISTVDVYKTPVNVNEDTMVELEGLHPYGAHRYQLEQFVRQKFDGTIIRLPGLFGTGLKKNVIYDLLHDNNVDRIHHAGSFQYYNLDYIWKDIQIALKHNLKLVNFATEPIRTDEMARQSFGMNFTNEPEGVAAGSYDMHTKYAAVYGGTGDYLYNKQQEFEDIKTFAKNSQAK